MEPSPRACEFIIPTASQHKTLQTRGMAMEEHPRTTTHFTKSAACPSRSNQNVGATWIEIYHGRLQPLPSIRLKTGVETFNNVRWRPAICPHMSASLFEPLDLAPRSPRPCRSLSPSKPRLQRVGTVRVVRRRAALARRKQDCNNGKARVQHQIVQGNQAAVPVRNIELCVLEGAAFSVIAITVIACAFVQNPAIGFV